jgi:protocatechuate 3,4-dioxygenase beta subunit
MHRDDHDDFGGLHRDLTATDIAIGRREALRIATRFGAAFSALGLAACGLGETGIGKVPVVCDRIPEETAGPFPGDGSNGANVLNLSGVVRQDITTSFAGMSGTSDGVPLSIDLQLVSPDTCNVVSGRAVYLWHCDRLGRYSLYSAGVTDQNYLRGVQASDASGRVQFTTIFPGCYSGRWPHIHFEVYPSLGAAGNVANKIATSQLALPKSACDLVYATPGYESSAANLAQVSLATDAVFSDGLARQIADVTGSVASGFSATLTVAV